MFICQAPLKGAFFFTRTAVTIKFKVIREHIMDLRVLKYFLKVAQEESISAAALKLGVTQPTLSRQLHELEEEFNAKLFNRGCRGRRITLTEKGAILRHRGEELLVLADKTCCELSCCESLSGNVYIGYTHACLNELGILGQVASDLRKVHPEVNFVLKSGSWCALYDQLERGTLDLCVVTDDLELCGMESMSLSVTTAPLGFLVNKTSKLAKKKELMPSDLNNISLLLPEDDHDRELIFEWLSGASGKISEGGSYEHLLQALAFVSGCDDNWAVACFKCDAIPPAMFFVPAGAAPLKNLSAVFRPNSVMPPAAEAFLKGLRARLSEK
ncbi:MAG TPA: hypothetical protein DCL74_02240 [Succinivibrionaceae bacterium]|nr:hypothetical protein [Succinivibrionaceae bacterium]